MKYLENSFCLSSVTFVTREAHFLVVVLRANPGALTLQIQQSQALHSKELLEHETYFHEASNFSGRRSMGNFTHHLKLIPLLIIANKPQTRMYIA